MVDNENRQQPGLQVAYDANRPPAESVPETPEDEESPGQDSGTDVMSEKPGVGSAILVSLGFFFSLGWMVAWLVHFQTAGSFARLLQTPLPDQGIVITAFLAPLALLWMLIGFTIRRRDLAIDALRAELHRRLDLLPDSRTWSDARLRAIGEGLRAHALQIQNSSDAAAGKVRELGVETEKSLERADRLDQSFDRHGQKLTDLTDQVLARLDTLDEMLTTKTEAYGRAAETLSAGQVEKLEAVLDRMKMVEDRAQQSLGALGGLEERSRHLFERMDGLVGRFGGLSEKLEADRHALAGILQKLDESSVGATGRMAEQLEGLSRKGSELEASFRDNAQGLNGLMEELRRTESGFREQLTLSGGMLIEHRTRMEQAADNTRRVREEIERLSELSEGAGSRMDSVLKGYNIRVEEVGESVEKATRMLGLMSEALARHGDGLVETTGRLDARTAKAVDKLGKVMGVLRNTTQTAQARIDMLAAGTNDMLRDLEQTTQELEVEEEAVKARDREPDADSHLSGRVQELRQEINQAAEILARLRNERAGLDNTSPSSADPTKEES